MAHRDLYIGNKKAKTDSIVNKIHQDIDFLNAKILYIEGQHNFSADVLKAYQAMLESRFSVLDWLEHPT